MELYEKDSNTITGKWTCQGSLGERKHTQILQFYSDGSYEVEARNNDDNSLIAKGAGTYTFDSTKIYYNSGTIEEYYLYDNGNKLVIRNNAERPWTRI